MPQEMRNPIIITLYKNKSDCSDCNNYRGVSLLGIVGKIFASVVLNRLQFLFERVYLEAQCGFRAGRLTVDMISMQQLPEEFQEQRCILYIVFIELINAFDGVKGLFTLLQMTECPAKLLRMIMCFHVDMLGVVQYDGSCLDPFPVSETRQHTFPDPLRHLHPAHTICLQPVRGRNASFHH